MIPAKRTILIAQTGSRYAPTDTAQSRFCVAATQNVKYCSDSDPNQRISAYFSCGRPSRTMVTGSCKTFGAYSPLSLLAVRGRLRHLATPLSPAEWTPAAAITRGCRISGKYVDVGVMPWTGAETSSFVWCARSLRLSCGPLSGCSRIISRGYRVPGVNSSRNTPE